MGHTYYSNYSDSCSVSGVKIRGTSGTAYFDNIGGFVGYVTLSNFHDCTASGVDISASGRALYVGGFVGTVAANGYDPAKVTIERSTAAGTIELSAAEATSRGVGGFIGSLWNEGYTGFKWEGETTISGCTSNLDVNSVTTAGGFIGLAGGDYSSLAPENLIDAKLIVKNCRANGSVYSVSGTAGGFVGFGYRGTFAYADGSGYWVNPANDAVRQYIAALCKELAEMGFEEIYCSYMQLPGTTADLELGEDVTRTDAVMGFAKFLRRSLHGTKLSIICSVDSAAYDRASQTGQDLSLLPRVFDRMCFFTDAATL
ncbi:MAG: hypothetical protein IIT84_04220, partial [Oscillospiraceae bacterium]|nr:hypothetical protein [Oscillospiraceae bacterium]